MKVLITGASGFIGSQLSAFLKTRDIDVWHLVRQKDATLKGSDKKFLYWDIERQKIDPATLENFDVIIHLAGENIANGRWNAAKKKEIFSSRVKSTTFLANTITKLLAPPKMFLNASAVGYYGDRGEEVCTEETSNGSGFLAEVCNAWEEAAQPIVKRRIRTIFLRTGIVLSSKGGVLKKMLTPFSLGLGGKLGSGKQYMSWIAMKDFQEIILFAMRNQQLSGPVNMVSPNPVTNEEFTRILGKVLRRPTLFSVPASVLRVLLGREMADELLLSSIRAAPKKLQEAGYQFRFPTLEAALGSKMS